MKSQVILEEMDGKGVDISPLKKLLASFLKLPTSYDQERSTLADKATEVEELSAANRSYKEAKKKAESLRARRDAAQKEVEEIESKVSFL
ncbi:hypothetical protein RND71_034608 [Anisodus tanguticus]|uniref:Uncharacterized protein n=1 Tax=Anisodus tanguticus TaxID=243964 RepID=A0AAE1R9V4_9SOLA|nr:hypothetical protein RND71_034608 [Anisodus tanguticus]